MRTSCPLARTPPPQPRGRESRLYTPPPLFSALASASLPSRCPLKALSGRKFDYRVFAALPSSRPVCDMQVPGPPGPRAAAPRPPPPVRLGRTQPCPRLQHLPCLFLGLDLFLGVGRPTQAHVGGFRQVGGIALTQPLFSPQSPDFAEELRSLEPSPSPGEWPGQAGVAPWVPGPLALLPLSLPARPAGGRRGGHGAPGQALARRCGPRGGDAVQQPPPGACRSPWPGPSALLGVRDPPPDLGWGPASSSTTLTPSLLTWVLAF